MRKRVLSLLMVLCMLLTLVPASVFAEGETIVASGTCGDDLTWTLDSEGTLTISGTGAIDDYEDDDTPWDDYSSQVKSLSLGSGITDIGRYAFVCLKNLASVSVDEENDSFATIDGVLFNKDKTVLVLYPQAQSATSYTVPDGVTAIDFYAFCGAKGNLEELNTNGVVSFDKYALYGVSCEITVPETITYLGDYAFMYSGITEASISVSSIPKGAFCNCSKLQKISLLSVLSSIGENAFFGTNLKQVNYVGSNLDQVSAMSSGNSKLLEAYNNPQAIVIDSGSCGENVSWKIDDAGTLTISGTGEMTETPWIDDYSDQIKTVVIEPGVTSIRDNAFWYCSSLTSVTIPDSVTSIGAQAFYSCTGLTSVTIPKSVTSIGQFAFLSCNGLTSLDVSEDNENYASIDGVLFNKDKTELIQYPVGKTAVEYVIPDGVMSIETGAFYDCKSLTSITLPDSVTVIGEAAFQCSNLTSVTIPDSVTSIGEGAFYGCSNLGKVSIGSGVKSIGEDAFNNCTQIKYVYYAGTQSQWNEISIGSGNTYLTNAVLNCNHVHSYTSTVTTPATCTTDGVMTYTCECGESYTETIAALGHDYVNGQCTRCGEWSEDIVDNGTCGDNLTWTLDKDGTLTIRGTGAMTDFNYHGAPWYSYRAEIKSAVLDSGVETIGDGAFHECNNLTSVNIPNGVTEIGSIAFEECTSLTSIKIPNSVKQIGNSAFWGCSLLSEIAIGEGITSIGSYAFNKCNAITSITIPSGVERIEEGTFYDCSSLKLITIPESVTYIGKYVFAGCSSLKDVYYCGNIEDWLGVSFSTHDSNPCCYEARLYLDGELVTDLEIPNGVTNIGNYAFLSCTSMTSVIIPDSVTSIGDSAFYNCDGLEQVLIPDGTKSIGEYAFFHCNSLYKVYFPDSVESIGSSTFEDCPSLTDVRLPETVSYLGNAIFWGCSALEQVCLPKNLTSIGEHMFRSCRSLKEIVIPEGVTDIGMYAFGGCEAITAIVLPENLTNLGWGVFSKCTKLESIVIPKGVTSIEYDTFNECTSLNSVTMPSGITSIGDFSFGNCISLKSIIIPDCTTKIGSYAFNMCSNLADVYYCGTEEQWSAITIGTNNDYLTNATRHYHDYVDVVTAPTCTERGYTTYTCSICGDSYVDNYIDALGHNYVYGQCTRCGEWSEDIVDHGTCGNDLTWTLDKDGVLTIRGEGAMTSSPWRVNYRDQIKTVVIEDGVTSIRQETFSWCRNLTSVTIPDSVTSIGRSAFYGCDSLTNVTIPGSVTSIGSSAFGNCSNLTSINVSEDNEYYASIDGVLFNKDKTELIQYPTGKTATEYVIPNGVTRIGYGAFSDCNSLTSVTIPDSVTSIGNGAFGECDSLTSVTIPDSVTSIGEEAFALCTNLISVEIPDSVTSIGQSAFGWCDSLTSVTIPDSVTSIEAYTFTYCNDLTSVTIPDSVTEIGEGAFIGCNDLTSVTIPGSVTEIGEGAFAECSSLTSVTIPDSVTSIGEIVFYNCRSLACITIPNSVTSIEDNAFECCDNLTDVYYCGTEDQWNAITIDAGNEYLTNATRHYHDYTAVVTEPTCVEQGYTTHTCNICGDSYVDNYVDALDHNYVNGQCTRCKEWSEDIIDHGTCGDDLTWVLFNDYTLTIFGTGAMYDYDGDSAPWNDNKSDIKSVVINSGVTSIGEMAFHECSNLTSITIPDSVMSIGYGAFAYCSSLTDITMPDSVKSIGYGAFVYCSSLTSVTIPDSVTSIGYGAFYECSNLTSVTIGDGVTSIGEYAFYECSNLISITIPDSVTSIGEYTFYECINLTSVTMGDGVTSIGDYAFEYCGSLTSITISDSMTNIGVEAFAMCTNLTSVSIPASVTSIGSLAFAGCSSLTSIDVSADNETYASIDGVLLNKNKTELIQYPAGKTETEYVIPDGVESVEDGAFAFGGLTSVTIPDSVTSIGYGAFVYCSSLTDITIPDSVTSIEVQTFDSCESLTSVSIPDSVTSIENCAFSNCSSLADVYYCGTEEQWNEISVGEDNDCLTDATRHYHNYVDGVCTICGDKEVTIIASGTCGENLTWTLDSEGTLTISGTGEMSCVEYVVYEGSGYGEFVAPWSSYTSSIKAVDIKSGVTSIEGRAFSGCGSLTSVTIPDNITSIGYGAFSGCNSLASIDISEDNENYTSVDGVLFNKDKTELIQYPAGKTTAEYVIPDGVTSIGESAFERCISITSVTIPDSVTSIGYYTFAYCYSLKTVYISDSVTDIGYKAFDGCPITDVYYCGTEVQWTNIHIGEDNYDLKYATIHYHNYVDGVCTICGAVEPHEHDYTAVVTEPTCTEQGYTTHTCACGDSYVDNYVAPLGHDYTAIVTAPTCTEQGYTTYTCACGDSYVDNYVAPLGHSYTAKVTAPTCTEQGYTTYTCECGDSYVDDYVAPIGHDYVNGFCSKCGAEDPDYNNVIREGFIVVSDERARAGEEVTVSVSIEENPGIMVMILDLDYDESKLEFLGYEDGLMKGWRVSEKAVWIGGDNMTEDGVILKLKFKVLEDVEDGEIGVSVLYSAGDIANHDEKMIMPSELDGSIVVYTNVAGDITGDDKVNALDLVRLQRYLAGDDVEVNASCDVNGDGVINALDLVRLQHYLAGDDVVIC